MPCPYRMNIVFFPHLVLLFQFFLLEFDVIYRRGNDDSPIARRETSRISRAEQISVELENIPEAIESDLDMSKSFITHLQNRGEIKMASPGHKDVYRWAHSLVC